MPTYTCNGCGRSWYQRMGRPASLCPACRDPESVKYGHEHRKVREQWRPEVERGQGWCAAEICLEEDRWIPPDSEWHLGHTADGTGYLGPVHARCNTSEAAVRGNRARARAYRERNGQPPVQASPQPSPPAEPALELEPFFLL